MSNQVKEILKETIKLIVENGWRKTLYQVQKINKNNKLEIEYFTYSIPCKTCGHHTVIDGITLTDALRSAFRKVCGNPNLPDSKTFGAINFKTYNSYLQEYELPLYETKCLLAKIEPSIQTAPGYLFPMYININEWADKQTQENILQVLTLALSAF